MTVVDGLVELTIPSMSDFISILSLSPSPIAPKLFPICSPNSSKILRVKFTVAVAPSWALIEIGAVLKCPLLGKN